MSDKSDSLGAMRQALAELLRCDPDAARATLARAILDAESRRDAAELMAQGGRS